MTSIKVIQAEELPERGLNLPSGPKITEEEIRAVALSLQKALKLTISKP